MAWGVPHVYTESLRILHLSVNRISCVVFVDECVKRGFGSRIKQDTRLRLEVSPGGSFLFFTRGLFSHL